MIRNSLLFILGFLAGIIALALWRELRPFPLGRDAYPYAYEPAGTTTPIVAFTTTATSSLGVATTTGAPGVGGAGTSTITIATQGAGANVLVGAVSLPHDGWVAVHEIKGDVQANVLGAIRRDAGAYTELTVPLLRATVPGGTYRVVLYADNGDKEFSTKADAPMVDALGAPLTNDFTTL